ncbi:MAG: RNA methyltransferase [Bacteroidota bacterium]|nr:RNA methyltransferase [Bacteroidota bacterium]
MHNIIHIDSLDVCELQPYRTMRRAVEHVRQGIFVAETEKVVKRLLQSDLQIVSLLLTEKWFDEIKDLIKPDVSDDLKIFVGEKKLLETIVGFGLHQGIMAVGKIPKSLTIEAVIAEYEPPRLLVAVDGLTNSDNLGVIVRNCVAFGVTAIIVGETSSSPYLRRAVRMSMGSVFKLPVIHVNDLREMLIELSNRYGTRCLAADAHADDVVINEAHLNGNICIVLGSEGSGVRKQVLEACHERIKISVTEEVDSLNVASASAVFLYEAAKRR